MKGTKMLLGCALLAASLVASNAQAQTTLRMTWYSDGNEGEVMTDLLRALRGAEQGHQGRSRPGAVQGHQREPAGAAGGRAGTGPRARRRSRRRRTLHAGSAAAAQGPRLFRDEFRAVPRMDASARRHDLDPGLHDAAHRHRPVRQQDPVRAGRHPDAGSEGDLGRVGQGREGRRDEGQAPFPIAIDRSGHRFFGLAITQGAKVFDDKGEPAVVDDGFKKGAQLVYDWHKNGVMSKELWGSVAGTAYRGANDEFKNAQVVMYVSGSWQIGQFDKTIGNAFDWVAVPNPAARPTAPACRAARRWSPSRRPSIRRRSRGSWNISPARRSSANSTIARCSCPGHLGLAKQGIDYKEPRRRARRRSRCSAKACRPLSPVANKLQGYVAQPRDLQRGDQPARPGHRRRSHARRSLQAHHADIEQQIAERTKK